VRHDAVLALLAAGSLFELICALGVVWMREGFAQLHYSAAASSVGLAAFAAAVGLTGFSSASGTVDCMVALFLTFALSPVLVAATARAGRRMRYGTLEPTAREYHQQP
jgi:multisubunit Na+/H+ antiporter MnhG subunit